MLAAGEPSQAKEVEAVGVISMNLYGTCQHDPNMQAVGKAAWGQLGLFSPTTPGIHLLAPGPVMKGQALSCSS